MLIKGLPTAVNRSSSHAIGKIGVATSKRGLPRDLPTWVRRLISKGDIPTIRLWISLVGLYRVIDFTGKPSIDTIIKPGKVLDPGYMQGLSSFGRVFIGMLSSFYGKRLFDMDPGKILKISYIPISSAGSNSSNGSSSLGSSILAAYYWLEGHGGSLLGDYLHYLDQWEKTNTVYSVMVNCMQGASRLLSAAQIAKPYFKSGRLHFIPESAGKVRVVAMVDYWTQIALYPLHKFLFSLLKEIDQDGTFDQLKPVKALLKRTTKDQMIYSYDLSAATDRLPISIQKMIIGLIFTPCFADAWAALLIGRHYDVPDFMDSSGFIHKFPKRVKYAVGQPIGAYSSWAMLAMTHHFIVQFCARQAGYTEWFIDYAVLGDDIIIANDAVAKNYLHVMKALGVEIGLAKSLVASQGTLEFAKRLFFKGIDISGLPWKLYGVCTANLSVAVALLSRLGDQGISFSASNAVLAFGGSWKMSSTCGNSWDTISRRTKALLVSASHPNARTPFSFANWIEWLSSTGPSTPNIPKGVTMTWFTPWCTGLMEEYLVPLMKKIDKIHEEQMFSFSPGFDLTNPWEHPGFQHLCRLCDARNSKLIAAAEETLTLSAKSLAHLQKLNIKFMFHQASAVFQQVVTNCEDKLSAIPQLAVKMCWQKINNDIRPPVLRTLSTWTRWRLRAFTEQKVGTGFTSRSEEGSDGASDSK